MLFECLTVAYLHLLRLNDKWLKGSQFRYSEGRNVCWTILCLIPIHGRITMRGCVAILWQVLCLVYVHYELIVWTHVFTTSHVLCQVPFPLHSRSLHDMSCSLNVRTTVWTGIVTAWHILSKSMSCRKLAIQKWKPFPKVHWQYFEVSYLGNFTQLCNHSQ